MTNVVKPNFKSSKIINNTNQYKFMDKDSKFDLKTNIFNFDNNTNYDYKGKTEDTNFKNESLGSIASIFEDIIDTASSDTLSESGGSVSGTSSNTTPAKTEGVYIEHRTAADGYGPAFLDKVKQVANNHNMDYKELLGLMYSESTLNAHSDNGQGYVGFMQLGSDAARNCGTTREAIKNMTPIEQMDIIDKHLTNLEKSMPAGSHKASDYYAANFLPARCKNEVLTTSNESYYKQNKGLDRNKDGKITKSELDARIKSNYVDESSFAA